MRNEKPVDIQRATVLDLEDIRNLTRLAYAKWVPLINREPKPMQADFEHAVRNHLIDLIRIDGVLAALIEIIPEHDHLLIENLAVLPTRQGQGLASRLMHHAENLAVSLGYSQIKLYTNKKFTENIQFYLRLGYQESHQEEIRDGKLVHLFKRV